MSEDAAVAAESTLQPVGPAWRRGRLTAFVERHHLAWDLAFAALAVVYLSIGIAADVGGGPADAVLLVLAGVFLVEFVARIVDAPSRYAYFRGHWIDLVSAIPLVGGLRAVRLLRLARLGAALRILVTAEERARARGGGRHSLWYVGPALVVVWFSSAAAYYTLEHGDNAKVHDFGDALYWAFATATTVGYGAGTPVTAGGKVLSGALILVSIGLVGLISSRLVAAWLGADAGAQEARIEARLARMEDALGSIEKALARLEPHVPAGPRGDLHADLGAAADEAPG